MNEVDDSTIYKPPYCGTGCLSHKGLRLYARGYVVVSTRHWTHSDIMRSRTLVHEIFKATSRGGHTYLIPKYIL